MNFQYDFLDKIKLIKPLIIKVQGSAIYQKTRFGNIIIRTKDTIKIDVIPPPYAHTEIIDDGDKTYYITLLKEVDLTSNEKTLLIKEIKKGIYKEDFLTPKSCKICVKLYHYEEYKEQYLQLFKPILQESLNLYLNKDSFDEQWIRSNIYCFECLQLFIKAESMKRKCFECDKELDINDCLISSHNKNVPDKKMLETWLNPIFQFYCCNHYKMGDALFQSIEYYIV